MGPEVTCEDEREPVRLSDRRMPCTVRHGVSPAAATSLRHRGATRSRRHVAVRKGEAYERCLEISDVEVCRFRDGAQRRELIRTALANGEL